MSEIPNLIRLSKRIAVPEQYAGGVGKRTELVEGSSGPPQEVSLPTVVDGKEFERGAGKKEVADSAARLHARFNAALNDYKNTKQTLLSGKKPKTEEVAEYSAQKKLDEMAELVRRFAKEAGPDGSGAVVADMAAALGSLEKPQLAMILRRAGNPELFQPLLGGDLADVPMLREGDKAAGVIEVAGEQKKLDKQSSVESLPMIMRPSSHYNQPGGESDSYKSFKPKDHDPVEFDAKDPGLSPKTKNYALKRLAGDQVAQAKAMEKGGGRLTIGAGRSGDSDWVSRNSKSKNPDKGKPIDQVVENRNKSAFTKLQETIDRAGYDKAGNATEGTFDLDKYFPRWRTRVAEIDESGKMAYPARLPSAEYVTGMILGLHNFTEPGLYERWLPIVRRSIDAAPDEPSTPEALKYSQMVLKPNDSFREAMERGFGSKDYPYKIYGPRKVDLPEVTEPQAPQPQAPASRDDTRAKLDRLQKLRKKPGTGDQASIYMVPPNSPMSGLLA